MKKGKLLVVSALGAGLALSLAVGGTYAIFTSEAKTDIAITSGKVSVSAEIKDLKMYSGQWNDTTDEYDSVEVTDTFVNGGKATLEGGVLKLDRISPMDKVTFKISVKNNSNINAKYRIKTSLDGDIDLFTALDVKINNEEYLGFTKSSAWATIDVDYAEDVEVEVGLPELASNSAQGKNVNINFAVEAVQGNAHVEDALDDVDTVGIYNDTDLKLFAGYANAGKMRDMTAKLMDDIDLAGDLWEPIGNDNAHAFEGTIDGNGKTISNMTVEGEAGAGAGFIGNYLGITVKDLTFENALVSGVEWSAVVAGYTGGGGSTFENITVKNSTVNGKYNDAKDDGCNSFGMISGYLQLGGTGVAIKGCSIEDCTIFGYRRLGSLVGQVNGTVGNTGDNLCMINNTVKNFKINQDMSINYKNFTENGMYCGEFIGQYSSGSIDASNTITGYTLVTL